MPDPFQHALWRPQQTTAPVGWLAIDEWLVPLQGPHGLEILWFNDIHPQDARPPGIAMPDVWHVIDLAGIVPQNAVAVDLRGILLITRGADITLPDMLLWFAGNAQPGYDDYQLQCISANAGQRETGSVIVPLSAQQTFQFKWSRTGHGVYDRGPAYGLRLWAQQVGVSYDPAARQRSRP